MIRLTDFRLLSPSAFMEEQVFLHSCSSHRIGWQEAWLWTGLARSFSQELQGPEKNIRAARSLAIFRSRWSNNLDQLATSLIDKSHRHADALTCLSFLSSLVLRLVDLDANPPCHPQYTIPWNDGSFGRFRRNCRPLHQGLMCEEQVFLHNLGSHTAGRNKTWPCLSFSGRRRELEMLRTLGQLELTRVMMVFW